MSEMLAIRAMLSQSVKPAPNRGENQKEICKNARDNMQKSEVKVAV